jgi:hypothetical protein
MRDKGVFLSGGGKECHHNAATRVRARPDCVQKSSIAALVTARSSSISGSDNHCPAACSKQLLMMLLMMLMLMMTIEHT